MVACCSRCLRHEPFQAELSGLVNAWVGCPSSAFGVLLPDAHMCDNEPPLAFGSNASQDCSIARGRRPLIGRTFGARVMFYSKFLTREFLVGVAIPAVLLVFFIFSTIQYIFEWPFNQETGNRMIALFLVWSLTACVVIAVPNHFRKLALRRNIDKQTIDSVDLPNVDKVALFQLFREMNVHLAKARLTMTLIVFTFVLGIIAVLSGGIVLELDKRRFSASEALSRHMATQRTSFESGKSAIDKLGEMLAKPTEKMQEIGAAVLKELEIARKELGQIVNVAAPQLDARLSTYDAKYVSLLEKEMDIDSSDRQLWARLASLFGFRVFISIFFGRDCDARP